MFVPVNICIRGQHGSTNFKTLTSATFVGVMIYMMIPWDRFRFVLGFILAIFQRFCFPKLQFTIVPYMYMCGIF